MVMMEWDALLHPAVHRPRRTLFLFFLASSIYAFSPLRSSRRCRIGHTRSIYQLPPARTTTTAQLASLDGNVHDDDDDDDWRNAPDDVPQSFASRSQIPQFIDAFLERERDARGEVRPNNNKYTHMIGVPMAECHELQIELESVQRAILYHCPSLIHACIVPTMSRMPLLYVDASREPAGSVTMELHQMVHNVVRKHCYVKDPQDQDNTGRDVYDDVSYSALNAQGYKPLTMSFHKLQIDGEGNEALFTVADRDSAGGLARLEAMMADLRATVEERGWKCQWPPSDVQGMQEEKDASGSYAFVPRIALLRLPPNFESYLRPLVDDDDHRMSEDGGNGISPVFWIKWEKDTMGSHVRLREVGIYPRRPGFTGFDEQTFYLPHETVKLPHGNEALSQQEKIHRDYNEQRMKESERALEELESGEVSPDGDFADPNLASNRQMLESIFGMASEALEKMPFDALDDDVVVDDTVDDDLVDDDGDDVDDDDDDDKMYMSKSIDLSTPDLPDFPSEEHLRGFWRVVRSPLSMPDVIKDDSRSDNFVLRVDGTVAGGPVLDEETFNKASGGTWRLLESIDESLLRIRLVIPPKKDRIMVWEGQVFKDTESSLNSISILDATSFGKMVRDTKGEEVIKCSGKVSCDHNCCIVYANASPNSFPYRLGSRML